MINYIWAFLIVIGTVAGAFTGHMQAVGDAAVEGAKEAGLLCVSLIGAYALWLGVLNVAKEAGLIETLARRMRGVVRRLFPGVPADSEANGLITLNIVANMLGMGNAATPFGLQAMKALQALGKDRDEASDAMCMLIIINASSVQLLPLTVIALRSAAGSAAPAEIVLTALISTTVTTTVGIVAGKVWQRFSRCR